MAKRRLICISNNRLYFTPKDSIDALPIFPSAKFKPRGGIYWEVAGTFKNGIATLTVTDYHPEDVTAFNTQKLSTEIFQASFDELNWDELEKVIWTYSGWYKTAIQNAYIKRRNIDHSPGKEEDTVGGSGHQYEPNFTIVTDRATVDVKTETEEFEYSYKQAVFGDRYVEVVKRFARQKTKKTIRIYNDAILPQFDAIKYYFGKAINGQKNFKVRVTFTLKYGTITDYTAHSDEISQINSSIIDKVRRTRIYSFADIPRRSRTKSLLTAEELQKSAEGNTANPFNDSAVDIIEVLINKKGLRNAKQLQYLSGHIHGSHEKIRFSLKPLFGFLFSIEGSKKHHYCWELLNSHATYIWSFDKETAHSDRVEEIISLIHQEGREPYKLLYKDGQVDQDSSFSTIHHVKSANGDDGFVIWKSKLAEKLI
jgi:hypothetical protein